MINDVQLTMKKEIKYSLILFCFLLLSFSSFSQGKTTAKIGLLKYKGGGDWYANPTSLPNLAKFCNQQLHFKNLRWHMAKCNYGKLYSQKEWFVQL